MRTHPIVCYRPKSGPNPRKGHRYVHMRRRTCALTRRRRDGALASRPVCGEDARGRCRWGGSEKESFSSTRRAFLAVVVVAVVDVRVAALGPRDANPQPRNAVAVTVRVFRSGTRHLVCRTTRESLSGPTRERERERKARAHLVHDNVAPAFHACASSRRLAVAPRKRPRLAGEACKVIIPPCRRRHRHHLDVVVGGGGASAGGDCLVCRCPIVVIV